MTEKLEELLAAEFRDGPYDLPVDADRLTTTARRRRARRTAGTAAAAVCAVALGATAGISMLNASGPGPADLQPAGPALSISSAPATPALVPLRIRADSVQIGEAVVRGLPAEAELLNTAGAAQPPAAALPSTGDRASLSVPGKQDAETRLTVVVDAQDRPGLPGDPEPQDWFGSLGGAKALLTVDDSAQTTYFTMNTPAGRRWDLAATGADATARLALIKDVAVATAPGR
ncbi:hypothetical protein FHR83_002182 [Actinoplanes campanulatus]|uniref:Uncharacterized protein n=1 Tax=Actinoplanes campanulatus TaxID=113559 RepID=A0A7W5AEG8_9ACTN|nr:hypothetical protein [Actinoplanes campanulatus]MBB3094530.1 hypothetical protein [Actinoplanes campanulatus]GGN21727.1 hypothetical protein GCM10010109_35960 [Actinoplanes campanulatus]GID35554.1 hypothetical protein Aca09nite_20600 [Actinoplanes campanulatus]